MKPALWSKFIPLFAFIGANALHCLWVSEGKHWKQLRQNQTPRPNVPDLSQDTCSFARLRFMNRDLWVLLSCFPTCGTDTLSPKTFPSLAAFWLVFRPLPLLSDGGNKAFPPESSVRWRGNGLHSNELFLQASSGSLFLYPLARGTNSKQQPNPWASKSHRNSADLTVRGSPWKISAVNQSFILQGEGWLEVCWNLM